MKKTELPFFNIDNENEINPLKKNDNNKEKVFKEIYNNKITIKRQFQRIYYSLLNKKDSSIRYLFFILIVIFYIEFYLINLTDIFVLKLSIAIIFLVPLIILTIEYERFFQVCSLFEINSIIFIKILILFSVKLSYFDILIFNIILNGIYSYFIKKLYIHNEFLGVEIKDRKKLRINIFISNFKLLLFNYLLNTLYFIYLFYQKKLSFYLFDELIPYYDIIYYQIFIILSNRKFFKFLYKSINIKYSSDKINNAKLILFLLIIIQVIIIAFLSKHLFIFLYIFFIIILFWTLNETIGNFIYIFLLLIYCVKRIGKYYIKEKYNSNFQNILYYNFFYIYISFLFSLVFIISIFYMEKDNLSKIYTNIYQRFFQLKVLFDIWFIINFIYRLYKQNQNKFYDNFNKVYQILFLCFIFNYILIYFIISLKLTINITEEDINWYFDDLRPYIKKNRLNNAIFYGYYTPYIEIKFYQRIKKIFSNFNENMNKNQRNKIALKKILNFIIHIIFCFFAFIINDSSLFYIVYFILIQSMHKHFKKIGKKIYDFFIFVKFQIEYDNDSLKTLTEKIRQKKLNKFKKGKYKLMYILLYPYIAILWKVFFSKIYLIIYEKIIVKLQFYFMGKLDPVGNVIYQLLNYNNLIDDFSFLDFALLILFILPNTICILVIHINEIKPNFFFQNYIITSFIGIFIKTHPLVLITGIVNIFIMINIFAADEETYNTLFFWFDLLGINSSDFFY